MKAKKKNVIAIILGGGQGSRLYPLTETRSKPAVPIGGKYRLVDIPISNCMNSDIYRMFVLTQFNSASLNAHIKNTYNLSYEQFNDMHKNQNGLCKICGQPPRGKKSLHIDHCHESGKVRGLLCVTCNWFMGKVDDNIVTMTNLIEYIKENK